MYCPDLQLFPACHRDASGHVTVDRVPIAELVHAAGTPVYVYSANTIAETIQSYKDGFRQNHLSDIKICYAVKANDALAVLAYMHQLGVAMDVVSIGEAQKALAAGANAPEIVFSGVGKRLAELEEALALGIGQMNVESVQELEMLNVASARAGKTARVAVRVNPDVDAKSLDKISTGRKEDKFGIPISDVRRLFDQKSAWPHLEIVGLAVHIGSKIMDLAPFETAYRKLLDLIAELRQAGHTISELDLGGGLGVAYDEGLPPPVSDYCCLVSRLFRDRELNLTIEPGRSLVAAAGLLVCRVTLVKQTSVRNFVVLDAAMNDFVRPAMYGANHPFIHVEGEAIHRPNITADLVGPICESTDVFAKHVTMPAPKEGDLIAFGMAGAYCHVMTSRYNARPLPPEILTTEGKFDVITPKESIEDMIAREHVPEWLTQKYSVA